MIKLLNYRNIFFFYFTTTLLILSTGFSFGQTSRLGGKTGIPYQDNYQRVTAGYTHFLEIKNGKLYAAGNNNHGQLGNGSIENTFSPVQIGSDENWSVISAGDSFSVGIKADGSLWSWGKNTQGQLGTGNTESSQIPVQVGNDSWFAISAGASFVLAVKSDGTLWSWGDNMMGQLGNGQSNYTANPQPVQVGTDNNWVNVSAGYMHGLAIKSNGTIWSWGANAVGQLGNGETSHIANPTPVQIGENIGEWKYISAGGFFSSGIKNDGTLWVWGDNYYGQIANGNTDSQTNPVQIGTDKWRNIYAGRNHIVAIKTDGTLWSWGDEMGTNTSQVGIPTQKTISGIVQISAGDSFSFALDSNGKLYSWGKNTQGQLGQGNTTDVSEPTFNGSTSREIIATASAHGFNTFTLSSEGIVKGWGDNGGNQLGNSTASTNPTPEVLTIAEDKNISIQIGFEHVLVLKDNGTIWTWGDGASSEAAIQVGTDNDWISIATGSFVSAAIKSDGSLWMWGSNFNGELGTGDTQGKTTPTQVGSDNDWIAVATGSSHTIALKSDGTLWGWGRNYVGEAGGGQNTDNVLFPQKIGEETDWVYVSAGSMTSYAIKTNGSLWGWGASGMGQLGLELPLPTKVTVPTKIGETGFIQARVANWSGAGITDKGLVMAWGNLNTVFGELGMGDQTNYPAPTQVPAQENVVHISGGQAHKNILKSDRNGLCVVGRNFSGELGLGEGAATIVNAYQCNVASFEEVTEDDYCEVSVDWDIEPITLVDFSDLNNPTSAAIDGTSAYEDFTAMIANVEREETYTLKVKGNTGNFSHDIRVFIDWNQDFEFDMTNEYYTALLGPSNGEDNTEITIEITIPENAVLGNTRMRIIKDHWTDYEEGEFDACTNAYYGQVEDYTVNVQEASLGINDFNTNLVNLYPNPTNGILNINSSKEIEKITVFNLSGQNVLTSSYSEINLSSLNSGVYIIKILSKEGHISNHRIVKY